MRASGKIIAGLALVLSFGLILKYLMVKDRDPASTITSQESSNQPPTKSSTTSNAFGTGILISEDPPAEQNEESPLPRHVTEATAPCSCGIIEEGICNLCFMESSSPDQIEISHDESQEQNDSPCTCDISDDGECTSCIEENQDAPLANNISPEETPENPCSCGISQEGECSPC